MLPKKKKILDLMKAGSVSVGVLVYSLSATLFLQRLKRGNSFSKAKTSHSWEKLGVFVFVGGKVATPLSSLLIGRVEASTIQLCFHGKNV